MCCEKVHFGYLKCLETFIIGGESVAYRAISGLIYLHYYYYLHV